MKPRSVRLLGGPFKGRHVLAFTYSGTLVIEGEPLPDGQAARYRPTRDPNVYRFIGLATVLARLDRAA